jgi:hypothetical protein
MKKDYITAKFYDKKNNVDFVRGFKSTTEFYKWMTLNGHCVLLRVEYAY